MLLLLCSVSFFQKSTKQLPQFNASGLASLTFRNYICVTFCHLVPTVAISQHQIKLRNQSFPVTISRSTAVLRGPMCNKAFGLSTMRELVQSSTERIVVVFTCLSCRRSSSLSQRSAQAQLPLEVCHRPGRGNQNGRLHYTAPSHQLLA